MVAGLKRVSYLAETRRFCFSYSTLWLHNPAFFDSVISPLCFEAPLDSLLFIVDLIDHYTHRLCSSLLSRSRSNDDLNARVKPEIQRCEFSVVVDSDSDNVKSWLINKSMKTSVVMMNNQAVAVVENDALYLKIDEKIKMKGAMKIDTLVMRKKLADNEGADDEYCRLLKASEGGR
ncbi:unnamed protein product [Vicia faba]|uniref:Uncharacterized protein n=1 Tax=Vicia faba TaxID=3906 RepID=A0AAV0ZGR5_VICFA|nr:unnamed protein product [Vicia faba]